MKTTTILVTLGVALAALAFSQEQGRPPQGGPPRGGPGFGGPGGPGMDRGLPPIDRLVFRRDVQEDIKLTDEQRSKLDAIRPQRRPGGPGGFGGGPGGPPPGGQGGDQGGQGGPPPPPPDQGFGGQAGQGGRGGHGGDRQAMEAEHRKAEDAIKAILTSDQFARVKEIGIQIAGNRAVLDKGVQSQLDITSNQKAQIDAIVKAQQMAMRGLFEKAQNGDMDREQMQQAMQANDKTFQSSLAAVLTEDQSSKLKAMGGAAFKATEHEGPGGPGGPPPGGGGFGGGGQ